MAERYTLDNKGITQVIEMGGSTRETTKDLMSFTIEAAKAMPFDSGWLPAGVRYYRQHEQHAQAVVVCPPGVNRITWGERERDRNAKVYLVAQPWRVIIMNMFRGVLYGARMFYSPLPVSSPNQQLYHQNVPNINCNGYSGNGVGWVCLYHNARAQGDDIGSVITHILERCSGQETYNNANMSITDGTRFYQKRGKPEYTWKPAAWEKKTEEFGVEWTFDSNLWIPVKVAGPDDQGKHDDTGVPLTIEMAMEGKYNAYYGDSFHPKPYLNIGKKENKVAPLEYIRQAFAKVPGAAKKKSTKEAKGNTQ